MKIDEYLKQTQKGESNPVTFADLRAIAGESDTPASPVKDEAPAASTAAAAPASA